MKTSATYPLVGGRNCNFLDKSNFGEKVDTYHPIK